MSDQSILSTLQKIYAAADPEGWDGCRVSGKEFCGGSLYTLLSSFDLTPWAKARRAVPNTASDPAAK
jgi:hypothetical protein